MAAAVSGVVYGLSSVETVELTVLHERQPLYVVQSDGSIQNRYTLKVLNKRADDVEVTIRVSGPQGLVLIGAERPMKARSGKVTPATVFVRLPPDELVEESVPVVFRVQDTSDPNAASARQSIFVGPKT
jgi:polyferredoxin